MRNTIIISFLLFGATAALGQISFIKLFSDNGTDIGQGIVQLEDSGYVITGSSSSFLDAPSQAFLMRIDSLGNYMWSNHYGGSESEVGRRVLYKNNFGYFICGLTNSIGNGSYDFYLAKIDENANLEWERAYGDYGWERVHDAAMTRDTGTIMVGETSSNSTDNLDMYIVRTDINGDTLWTKTIGSTGDDVATCIHPYNDSTYVIGGKLFVVDSMMTKGYLTYLHENGTVYWEDYFGDYGEYWVNDFCFADNKILGVGGMQNDQTDGIDDYAFYEDLGGNYWGGGNGGFTTPGDHYHRCITKYGADTNVYSAYSSSNELSPIGGEDITVARYSLPGFGWQNSFSIANAYPDVAEQFIRTSDGGAILVGYTTGIVSGGNEVLVMKIGPNELYPDPIADLIFDQIVITYEHDEIEDFMVYPNPASIGINVTTENPNYNGIRLVNAMGQTMMEMHFQFDAKIDLSSCSKGYYIVELFGSNTNLKRTKIIKY